MNRPMMLQNSLLCLCGVVLGALMGCQITLPKLPDIVTPKPPDITVPGTVTTTTTTTTTQPPAGPVTCTCGDLPPIVDIPKDCWGGECVLSSPLDIRFDGNEEKYTSKGFHFVGSRMAKYCKVERQADGMYRITMPCKEIDGYKVHVEGWNWPRLAAPRHVGNVALCDGKPGENGDNTFRWYLTWRRK